MPHLSGFEIIDGLDSKIPTMLITADMSPEVRQRALLSGVELLAKPFQVDEVLEYWPRGWGERRGACGSVSYRCRRSSSRLYVPARPTMSTMSVGGHPLTRRQ